MATMSVPSLFASASTKHTQSPSYLKRSSINRRSVKNVLASVDNAIEDGATTRAKEKASAERVASQRPVSPGKYSSSVKKSSSSGNLQARARNRSKSASGREPRRSKSTDNKQSRIRAGQKIKSKSVADPSSAAAAAAARNALISDDRSIRSIRSLVRNSPKKMASPATPAWKARLQKQRSIEKSPKRSNSTDRVKTPKSSKSRSPKRTPKSSKRLVQKKKSDPNPFLAPPLTADEPKKQKKEKKEKKDKKKKKKKSKDNDDALLEVSERVFNNHDVKLRNTQIPLKPDPTDLGDKSIVDLKRQIAETEKKLRDMRSSTDEAISNMEKNYKDTKEANRLRIMKCIHAQGKKNDEKYKAYKEVIDAKQKDIDDLRGANQRLRTTIQKLPKQMSELIFGNQSLEEANKEIAGHIEGLSKFDKKLQADQERLYHSSAKCKDEYLPRYRQQLWEGKLHLDSETKTKDLYRDCIIKITKKLEKSKQVVLMEEVASMVVETEGEVNPKFDPEFLSTGGMSSDSDDSDSSVSSYSSSSSESDFGF